MRSFAQAIIILVLLIPTALGMHIPVPAVPVAPQVPCPSLNQDSAPGEIPFPCTAGS